ncbi:alpha/beta fold hydrolase [Rhizobium sp. C4]|nr:alpha/beta fold hydrolase [Rhizobium sp. C4]
MKAKIELCDGISGRIVGILLVFFSLMLVSACASRPGPQTLDPRVANVPGAKIVTLYLATSRERVGPGLNSYNDTPSETLNFAEYKVSIPPTHKPGMIEYPGERPDPRTAFTVVSAQVLDRATFLSRISPRSKGKQGDLGIFVHGFNTNLAEAVFRQAQLAADANDPELDDVSVLFAWPSSGSISGYLADKATATASRDQLTELLGMAVKARPTGEITLIAHSMGGWLTSEALRQLKLTGQQAVLDRLKVVLAAPDIDGIVFLAQMQKIGRMKKPMTILVSKDDIALSVSSFISLDQMRIGSIDINNPRAQAGAREVNIQFIDISGVQTDDTFKHNRFASLAAIYPEMRKQSEKGGDALRLSQAGVFVFDAVGRTLTAPFAIGRRLAAKQ